MARQVRAKNNKRSSIWRAALVYILLVVGLASLTGFMVVHWVERQILTTDNWVEMVTPIPKNAEVANALSTYAVNQVFTATDLENRITQALPDRAAFLAAPLTDQLQKRLTTRTSQFIQSDQFQNIWRTANQSASQLLINSALSNDTKQSNGPLANFNIDIPSIKSQIVSFLGDRQVVAPQSDQPVGLLVNLKTSLQTIKTYIRAVDFLNGVLWLAALACLLGAIVLSRSRRKLIMIISASSVVLALLQLIGIKALRPYIINQLQDASFKPAIGVVYDILLTSFRNAAISWLVVSILVFVVAFICHRPMLERSKKVKTLLTAGHELALYKKYSHLRTYIRLHIYQIMAAVALFGLAVLAFVVDLTWSSGIRSALLIIILLELINLAAARPTEEPMKH